MPQLMGLLLQSQGIEMGTRSTIKTLPKEILAQINFMIVEGEWTIDQIVNYLADAGHDRSRSSVGRYRKRFALVTEKLKQSRELTEALVRDLGPSVVDGKQGRLLVEILRKLANDHLMKQIEGEASMEPGDFFFLAKALKEMAQANRLDQDFVGKIKEQASKEARTSAANQAEKSARERGLTKDDAAFIRAEIMGVNIAAEK